MEIWIIGGAIVALMIYVSTRIKRNAASAFAEETIETGEFALVKPEGFLSPVREDPEYAFEAFSKDFGSEEAEKFRQSTVTVRTLEGNDFIVVCEEAKRSVDQILAEEINHAPEGINTFWLRGEKTDDGAEMEIYHKIIEKAGKIFDLRISVLRENVETYGARVRKLLDGFHVK